MLSILSGSIVPGTCFQMAPPGCAALVAALPVIRGSTAVCELTLGDVVECVPSLARCFFRGRMSGCDLVGAMVVSVQGGTVYRQEPTEEKEGRC